jgi:ABC-type phosphate transport system auxiliary subunit
MSAEYESIKRSSEPVNSSNQSALERGLLAYNEQSKELKGSGALDAAFEQYLRDNKVRLSNHFRTLNSQDSCLSKKYKRYRNLMDITWVTVLYLFLFSDIIITSPCVFDLRQKYFKAKPGSIFIVC